MRYIMRKVFVLFFFAIILLCGCSEDKYECECCHTYKTDSQVDYYADEDMTICKDCADYALSVCRYCKEKYVTSRNEYSSSGYCCGCVYDGNVKLCGYCGDITEWENIYFEEYCGNCVLDGHIIKQCGWCNRPVFAYSIVHVNDEFRCLECYLDSLE